MSANGIPTVEGKSAVVIGGTRGIGRAIARAFATDAASFTTGEVITVDGGYDASSV